MATPQKKTDKTYETYVGKIAKVSKYGLLMEQHQDDEFWLSFGDYFEKPEPMVENGDSVVISTTEYEGKDGKQKAYIRTLERTKGEVSEPTEKSVKTGDTISNKQVGSPCSDKQILIIRQNAVGNAVTFHQEHDNITLEKLLQTAEKMEDWVLRPQERKDDIPF